MARFYVSSTFDDLKDYRKAVYDMLRKLRHDAVAMEDYVAKDQRPLDKCLEDVAACDAYIGIFAWRYGYIPPKDNPEGKSITELEYRKAEQLGKARLIFLLDPDASWPPKAMDSTTGDLQCRFIDLRRRLSRLAVLNLQSAIDYLMTAPKEFAHE